MVYRIYTVLQAPAVLNPLLQAGAFCHPINDNSEIDHIAAEVLSLCRLYLSSDAEYDYQSFNSKMSYCARAAICSWVSALS